MNGISNGLPWCLHTLRTGRHIFFLRSRFYGRLLFNLQLRKIYVVRTHQIYAHTTGVVHMPNLRSNYKKVINQIKILYSQHKMKLFLFFLGKGQFGYQYVMLSKGEPISQ